MTSTMTPRRQALGLAGFTVGWNVIEAVVAITAGIGAGSIALVGFGLDSTVEIGAALVVIWQFTGKVPEDRERLALRLIGGSFYVLAVYVAAFSLRDLISGTEPDTSVVGIVLTAMSAVVMPVLAWAKRTVARRIDSKTLMADSKQTNLCAYLSVTTLAGLTLNGALGWWWADPLAALVIAYVAVSEGREAWAGDVMLLTRRAVCGPTPA
jgi:divalent metal cation (Fe/Co/Zn/Cd) transporter